ncbi:transporter substrate-binding domain-containing protein [Bradyrhizobium sp. BRP22]|uniref:c-type cytochrome n=1 Tax=Bradyrhizobium sp. BRP22 TaxID=2793821 RepID=UPI001CD6887D|nr:transporter substrate-binding domain-containing protein [Bradyrhizobium sp. BRP22]MCA1454689.1 transporter substrate-binding domain-containing protein [Bradyrhizobium sp. BRP22]
MRPSRPGIDKECRGLRRARACAGILALAATLTGLAGPSRGAEAEPFRLCADPTNLPFSSDDPSQPGLYVEIGQALAQALGQPITYDWYKSYFGKRTVRVTLLGKQCDAMIGLPLSDDFMGPAVIFSRKLGTEGYALVANTNQVIGGIGDLKGKRVAVQFATTPQNLLAERDDIEKVTVLSPDEGMKALDQGKVDVAFIWGPVAGWLNKTTYGGRYRIQTTEGEGLSWDTAVGFAKTSKDLRDRVNAALPQLERTIAELSVKYGLPGDRAIRFTGASAVTRQASDEPAAEKNDGPAQSLHGTVGTGPGVVKVANAAPPEAKADSATARPETVSSGKEIFNGTCAHCHGPDAVQSERRIDLRLLNHRYGDDMRTKFWTTVQEGRPAKGMPAWKDVYTDDQFESIYAFLLTVQSQSND